MNTKIESFNLNNLQNYPRFASDPLIKVGGNINSLNINSHGNGKYTELPNIYAFYTFNGQVKRDNLFSIDSGSYTLGNISDNTVTPGTENNIYGSDIPTSILVNNSSFYHDNNSVIYVGGQLESLTIDQNQLNLYQYTSLDRIYVGNNIESILISERGNEIDDNYIYDIFPVDVNNKVILNNPFKTSVSFIGNNSNKIGNTFTDTYKNHGEGYGAKANSSISKGSGGKITTFMGLDTIIVNNHGSNYTNNDTIEILNCYDQGYKNVDNWISLENSFDFFTDNITDQSLLNFYNVWKYRPNSTIPVIKDSNFFTKNIINRIEILINNEIREYSDDPIIYREIEKLKFWTKSQSNDYILYSFAKNNNLDIPNGHCNFSEYKNLLLNLYLKDPSKHLTENYKYDIFVYFNVYKILLFENGTANFKFSN